ncbi:hypothetical protein SAMN05216319_3948 [Duganella sp. CF402]|uniref:hypothetical protein n=1 Tax=unclassified Duganella TaxID=2636909 RepID=UPI0008D49AC0|nr:MULTISPECIES: hypothetical protein [unclassified Duganella]RZT04273.1 hypothetical protein EV582_5157 [Duganella sp. BK701]SEM41921.1 hypothetical protein SAMN05216319_3948 [Duganella sp. CF402]
MNQHITSEINAQFIAVGCTQMMVNTRGLDYFHSKMDLYFHYSPDLQTGNFPTVSNSTEIVVVVESDTALEVARLRGIACEVVKLKDLRNFILYRAYSTECSQYRAAKQRFDAANESFNQEADTYDYQTMQTISHLRIGSTWGRLG